ncbi:excinuclease ABC subunit A [Jannaschia seohaensis]|uniref:Nickel/cobalt transporter regulator n=1 Tax=Jannaschia seohaensis TaxID=475081 RepID=A0A2Y9B401_9RHOB|nr:excinuclease ABC subunit A [Jannaschia seohaensis]PWJ12131.1 hypothetical protein BCF38_11766 [Jannaschia seohaensis]SSA51234.1 hypothetical protein SAMN05421539_11766 [Jannaschia seohaensis]
MTRFLLAMLLLLAPPALAQGNGGCPPGLAKKSPACVPPGQAKKAGYAVGDRYEGAWDTVRRDRYGLPPLAEGEAYVRVGDRILRLDREERIILDVVQLMLE